MRTSRKFFKNRRDSSANGPYYQETVERDPGHLAADYHTQNMLYTRGSGKNLSTDTSRQARFLHSDSQYTGHAYSQHDPYHNLRSQQLLQGPLDPHLNTQFRDLGVHQSLHSPSSFTYHQPIVPEHLMRYPSLEGMRFAEASRDSRQFNSISDPSVPSQTYEPPQYDPSFPEPPFEQENSYVMENEDGQKKKGGHSGKSQLCADAPVFVPNAAVHETKGEQKKKDFIWLVVGKS
ncbi:predicted protein [Aspergillus terreus NIH2624]|uniref:Uncharacterized protein n=1 Tax=Aspergillus terreus (strain NIH 2624 / FGSC A1156) TaxID=341663 RepID=Q0CM54_ASPTN|nr:uncharacterized protein ATEG_05230 [Aspergillus terreus NIH2624]EAU34299.1 predicted protein [Aspergillus terreus NIH2624]